MCVQCLRQLQSQSDPFFFIVCNTFKGQINLESCRVISKGNHMISSAIWNIQAQVNFFKDQQNCRHCHWKTSFQMTRVVSRMIFFIMEFIFSNGLDFVPDFIARSSVVFYQEIKCTTGPETGRPMADILVK